MWFLDSSTLAQGAHSFTNVCQQRPWSLQLGRRAAWVLNAEANPRVRVLTGRRWRTGTAELLPDDDAAARFGKEIPAWNEWFVRKAGTDMLTVRIRFDEP